MFNHKNIYFSSNYYLNQRSLSLSLFKKESKAKPSTHRTLLCNRLLSLSPPRPLPAVPPVTSSSHLTIYPLQTPTDLIPRYILLSVRFHSQTRLLILPRTVKKWLRPGFRNTILLGSSFKFKL